MLECAFNLRQIKTVSKSRFRKSQHYDGTQITSHRMTDLLPRVLANIGDKYQLRPDLILAIWPDIIGPAYASTAQAVSFTDGVLYVKVRNSTLLSLLNQNEKMRLLNKLRSKFPQVEIKNIRFQIG